MSVGHAPERAAFKMQETDSVEGEVVPVSRLAIVTLLLGTFSLLSIISAQLVPVSVFAAILGVISVVMLLFNKSVCGIGMAQIGLGLSVFSASWALSSTGTRDAHLYSEASKHAKTFLQLLSEGDTYRAFELKLAESERQIAGTNLDLYYKQLLSAPPVETNPPQGENPEKMPSAQSMKDGQTASAFKEFIGEASTAEVLSHGKLAQWSVDRPGGVTSNASNIHHVTVLMVDSVKPERKISIQLSRTTRKLKDMAPAASWQVESVSVVKP